MFVCISVLRDGNPTFVHVTDLVPGDVVVLERGPVFCDMVIVKAEHLVVEESALTGEANPVVKMPVESSMHDAIYDMKYHKIHTLCAGTTIVECGENRQELGLVLSTGSFTTKGKLLSDVLSYQRHKFKFDDEVKVVLFILLLQGIFLVTMVFHFLQDQVCITLLQTVASHSLFLLITAHSVEFYCDFSLFLPFSTESLFSERSSRLCFRQFLWFRSESQLIVFEDVKSHARTPRAFLLPVK